SVRGLPRALLLQRQPHLAMTHKTVPRVPETYAATSPVRPMPVSKLLISRLAIQLRLDFGKAGLLFYCKQMTETDDGGAVPTLVLPEETVQTDLITRSTKRAT